MSSSGNKQSAPTPSMPQVPQTAQPGLVQNPKPLDYPSLQSLANQKSGSGLGSSIGSIAKLFI